MGRTLPGQLLIQHAQPGDKRTSHLVGEVRPPMAKVQGMFGILGAVREGFLVKAGHVSTPENSHGSHFMPASPSSPLRLPYIRTDDLKARRERIQGEDLVP